MLFTNLNPRSVRVVRHRRRSWAVRFEGDPDPVFIYRTQSQAIAHGILLARDRACDLVVHNDGRRRHALRRRSDADLPQH
jgi:hypothetical protein